jgi:TRAP transporter TAXI family solute receptor
MAKTRYIVITAGGMGGSWYPMGGVMAKILSAEVPDLKASCTPGGAVKNVRDVNKGKADIGFTFANNLVDALNKNSPFDKENIDNVRGLLSLFPLRYQMGVKKDSDIYGVGDLKNKRISPGKIGFGGEILTRIVLKEYGLSYEKIKAAGGKVTFASSGQSANLIKDGHLDFHASITFAPAAFFMDLASVRPIRLLPLEADVVKRIIEKHPAYFVDEIKAKTYTGQDKAVKVLAVSTALFIRKDLPDDLVYQIAKALLENSNQIAEIHKAGKQITLDTAIQGIENVPLHPGAEKYYKEKGLIK